MIIAAGEGRLLGCDDVGTGLPVCFLHGFPHDRSLWNAQLGALAVPARTVAFDLPGFGESTPLASPSVEGFADAVVAGLDTLGIDRAVITGLSMGGYVALALWRRHPSRVRALVLADTRATADGAEGRARRDALIAAAREHGAAAVAEQMAPGMVGRTTRAQRRDVVAALDAMMRRAPLAGVLGGLAALRDRPDATPSLGGITVPTLVVCGDEDVLTPPSDARALHFGIPGSRLELLAGAGHVTCVERPAAFNHVLSEFLTGLVTA